MKYVCSLLRAKLCFETYLILYRKIGEWGVSCHIDYELFFPPHARSDS